MLGLSALFSLLLGTALTIPAVADRGSSAPPAGTWARDIFGTGETTSVEYASRFANGTMTLDLTVAVPDSITYEVDSDDDDHSDEAEVEITFHANGREAELEVKAEMTDGAPKVEFEFDGPDGDHPRLPTPRPPGDDDDDDDDDDDEHSWSGQFCTGESFTIDYEIDDREVEITKVTGPPSRVEETRRGARVYFDDHDAKVTFTMTKRRSQPLRIEAKLGHCKPGDGNGGTTTTAPPAPPTTTPTTAPSTTTPSSTSTTAQATTTTTASTTSTAPPTTPAPTTTPTTAPPTTPPAKQVKYLTYVFGLGEIVIRHDEPRGEVQFWAYNPTDPAQQWYTYEGGKEPGPRVRTAFSGGAGSGEFIAELSGSSVSATFGGATVAPTSESTVAPPSTNPSV